MNPLLDIIEQLTSRELTIDRYPTGTVKLKDALDALQRLELLVRAECECEETKRLITDKAY